MPEWRMGFLSIGEGEGHLVGRHRGVHRCGFEVAIVVIHLD